MQTIDYYLEKVVRVLWLLTLYLGISAVLIGVGNSFSWQVVYITFFGVFNLINSYGLFRKTKWAWRLTFFTALFNLLFFFIYLVPVGIFLNLMILYITVKFKEKLGGNREDRLLPKKLSAKLKF